MPNIPVYTSQVRPARPNAAQATAAANIGEARGAGFRAIGETIRDTTQFIDAQQGQRETSKLTKDYAETLTGLAQDWNTTAAQSDPNDPELANRWIEEKLNPVLDKFGEDAWSTGGMELRERLQAQMRLHFFEKSTADQASLAGAAVQGNLEQSANVLAAGVRVDPTSMQAAIDGFNATLEAQMQSHNLTAVQRAQMRAEVGDKAARGIALAAGLGMAERNPAAAKAELAKGEKSSWGKYLDAAGVERITEAITEQERAIEVEKNRAEAAEHDRKVALAEEANNEWSSKLIIDPTKVDPRAIANDPRLSGDQKRVITNFQDEEIRKRKAGMEEGGKGPGFWSAYQRVFANGFKNTDEIYALVGPGKPLELSDANALATLWRGRRENTRASDFQDERVKSFFDGMHNKMTKTQFGLPVAGGEEAWRKFYFDKTRAIDNRGDKSLDQLIDEDSPDYVGKDYESYLPQKPASSGFVPLTPEKERTWMDFFGGLIGGGPAFKIEQLDKITEGAQGLTALKAAIATGAISKEQAGEYMVKRGWARPNEAKPQVAPAMK